MRFLGGKDEIQEDIKFKDTYSHWHSLKMIHHLDHQNAFTGEYFYTINSTDNQTKCLCLKLRPPYKN